MTPAGRRGFSIIELLIGLLIIATLTGLALPNLNRAILRARAVEATSHMNSVRVAILNYEASALAWPAETDAGEVPPELDRYLPDDFSFSGEDYVLDYDDLSDSGGFVAVTLVTDDPELGLMALELLGNDTWTNGSDRFGWVVQWTD